MMTSAAASPRLPGPRPLSSPSAGPVGIREARPRPRPLRLRAGCVIVGSSRARYGGRNWSLLSGRLAAFREFSTGVEIAQRPAGAGVVAEDRHAIARGFGDFDAARDHRA